MSLTRRSSLLFITLLALPLTADQRSPVERLLNEIVERERTLIAYLAPRNAIVETYIQEIPEEGGTAWPGRDHYFLGRLNLDEELDFRPLEVRSTHKRQKQWLFLKRRFRFEPAGFAEMIFPDRTQFNREDYSFEYVRREFLGTVRCLVFDVAPVDEQAAGRFVGRMWVEDRAYSIVRFNGTYSNSQPRRTYFHFDSWRVHAEEGWWIPAFVYIEESNPSGQNSDIPLFKAQTRLWGYNATTSDRLDELTSILVESESSVKDTNGMVDISPLSSQRLWEQQAEQNVLDRLEKSGLLAPKSEVDDVLRTVINNLIVTNQLALDVQCRVLLTTPLESFTVGNTVVISRGLIDVLPDEASLATVLAAELAHILLGHQNNTQFAFQDEMMLPDEDLVKRLQFSRTAGEIEEAARRAFDILSHSPYKEKLSNAGLFLKALNSRAAHFPNLIRANLGNQLATESNLVRMSELAASAPDLEADKLDQIAALPLGSRVKLDPWTNKTSLMKTEAVSLRSASDKLPFEITPVQLQLVRRR